MNVEQPFEAMRRQTNRWRATAVLMALVALGAIALRSASSAQATAAAAAADRTLPTRLVQIGPNHVVNLAQVTYVSRQNNLVQIHVSGPPGSQLEFTADTGSAALWKQFEQSVEEHWDVDKK